MLVSPGQVTQSAVLAEMSKDGAGTIDIPIEEGLISALSEGDKSPMFVTIEVINEGVSRNGRAYDKSQLLSIAEQINAKRPEGYQGHLSDTDRATKFPEPQTIWIGAKVEEVGGKMRLFAKGYVLPEAKGLRSYLKKAKAAGKNVAVSVYGTYKYTLDKTKNVRNVVSLNLESIDWARPGSEGVPNMGMFAIASEMTDDSNINPEEGETMKREEVLQSATVDELKEHNPNIVSEMVSEAVTQKETEFSGVVSEMTEVRSVLGIEGDASAVEIVKEMQSKISQHELDTQLSEKVESGAARKVVKELVLSEMSQGTPVAEAVDKVLSSETGQAVVKEMLETAPRVAPKTMQPLATGRKFTKKG